MIIWAILTCIDSMKYFYYTLYLFYVKIIRLHKQYPPIINITAVIAILLIFLILSLINTYYYSMGYKYPPYSYIIPGGGYLILWWLLYKFYKPREKKILKEIKSKPLWLKVIIICLSILFVIIVVKLWMFDGAIQLYQWIQSN